MIHIIITLIKNFFYSTNHKDIIAYLLSFVFGAGLYFFIFSNNIIFCSENEAVAYAIIPDINQKVVVFLEYSRNFSPAFHTFVSQHSDMVCDDLRKMFTRREIYSFANFLEIVTSSWSNKK